MVRRGEYRQSADSADDYLLILRDEVAGRHISVEPPFYAGAVIIMRLVSWVELGSHLIGENPNMAEFIHVKLPDFIPVERKVGGIIHGCAALWVIAYQASVFRAHPYFAVGGSGHSGVVARLGDPDGFLSVFKCIQPFVVDHPQRLPFLKKRLHVVKAFDLKIEFTVSYVISEQSVRCGYP